MFNYYEYFPSTEVLLTLALSDVVVFVGLQLASFSILQLDWIVVRRSAAKVSKAIEKKTNKKKKAQKKAEMERRLAQSQADKAAAKKSKKEGSAVATPKQDGSVLATQKQQQPVHGFNSRPAVGRGHMARFAGKNRVKKERQIIARNEKNHYRDFGKPDLREYRQPGVVY